MRVSQSRPTITGQDIRAVTDVLRSGMIAQGAQVKAFEEDFARYFKMCGAVATSSGMAAMHLALMALKVDKGDEVIIPAYACAALMQVARYCKAQIILADIQLDNFNMCPQDVARRVTKKTKAIIVPHMFGCPADMRALKALGVPIVEDCAHAVGATTQGAYVGTLADISIFSFYATKMLATGEGGMVMARNKSLLALARDRRDYDHKRTDVLRFNYKMTDMEAALGRNQLRHLQEFIDKRAILARTYTRELSEEGLGLPILEGAEGRVFYRYVVQAPQAGALIRAMARVGVDCTRPVFKPARLYLSSKDYPITDQAFKQAVSLPIYPCLRVRDVQMICRHIKNLRHSI